METPLVGIVAGSKQDLRVMERASQQLEEAGVGHTVDVLSVHHDPDGLSAWASGTVDAGYRVLIAGASGAAHLPGVIASHTTLPVIGVPLLTERLGGADALYSMIQMPLGVPVATVGVDSARNAAVLALQILGATDPELAGKVAELRREQAEREHREVATGSPAADAGFGFRPRG